MRVLLDLPLASGGIGRYAYDLRSALGTIDQRIEVSLVARPRLAPLGGPFTPWSRVIAAVRVLAARPLDLVHGLHFDLPRSSIPQVVTIPDLIPLQYPASMPSAFRRRIFERTVRRSIESASAVIVHSPATSEALLSHGFPVDSVAVIPHGVGSGFRPSDDSTRLEARERYAGGAPYVASIGSLKAHKNLACTIVAAKLLASDGIQVCVVGIPSSTAARAASMRAIGRLPSEELSRFLAGAEAVLVPSYIEGFGLPALEALACGTPVVCGVGLGALPYIEQAALVVDVDDPVAVADALRSLVGTPLRENLSDRGREIARQMSLEAMGRATAEVYRSVLG